MSGYIKNNFFNELEEEDKISLKILDLLLKDKSYFVKPLLQSYNTCILNIIDIIKKGIQFNIDNINPESPTYILEIEDVKIEYPTINFNKPITATVAFSNQLNYVMSIYCKFSQTIILNNKLNKISDSSYYKFVDIPIMVCSDYCLSKCGDRIIDPLFQEEVLGGYFILGGNKRVINFRHRFRFNEVLILPLGKSVEKKGRRLQLEELSCILFSKKAFSYPFYSYNIEILFKNNIFYLIYTNQKERFSKNLFSVIKKMSSYSSKQIVDIICTDTLSQLKEQILNKIIKSLEESDNDLINEEDLKIIKNNFIHIKSENLIDYLFFCLKKYLRVAFNLEDIDDRDSFSKTKLIDTPGSLIEELFINYIRNTATNLKKYCQKNNINQLINTPLFKIEKIFHTELLISNFISSKNWGSSNKMGVCQLIQPLNYNHEIQLVRKLTSESVKSEDSSISVINKRRSGAELQGFICTITSPTSKNIGLQKYLSSLVQITDYNYKNHFIAEEYINKFINENKIEEGFYSIIFDGELIKTNLSYNYILKLHNYLDNLRKNHYETNYIYTNCHYINEKSFILKINTYGGRLIIPVIKIKNIYNENNVLENLTFNIKFDQIKNINTFKELEIKHKDVIDWIDITGIYYKSIGYNLREMRSYQNELKIRYKNDNIFYVYNYCHIDSSAVYSLPLAVATFVNTQAQVRNLHQAKQHAGCLSKRPYIDNIVINKSDKCLLSGSKSFVKTFISDYINYDKMLDKIIMFAQLKSDACNQEDAYIINQMTRINGRLAIYIFKTFSKEVDYKMGDKLKNPSGLNEESNKSKYLYNFSKLGDNGLIKINQKVYKNDVLICKIAENKLNDHPKIDIEYYNSELPGRVISVDLINQEDSKIKVIIKVVQLSIGEAGDKKGSTHGQKGVIGSFLSPHLFGSNEYGFRSSIQISPSCMSRLTGAQLLEPYLSYCALINGTTYIQDPVKKIDINKLRDYIEEHNIERNFLSKLYIDKYGLFCINSCCVFILPMRRLKQLTDQNDVKTLSSEVNQLTKNPIEGSSLRLGKMEHDAYVNWGVSNFLTKTFNTQIVILCNNCGLIVNNKEELCPLCERDEELIKIKIPYALKVLIDYCLSLGILIKPHVNLKNIKI